MSVQIIPALYVKIDEDFKKKLDDISFAKKIHIDFMDGIFVPRKSFEISNLNLIENYPSIQFEIHLMVEDPLKYLKNLAKFKNLKKVLFHFESIVKKNPKSILKKFKEKNFQVFLVLNPQTDIGLIYPYLNDFDGIMLMSVNPGKQGQDFIDLTYKRIKLLKALKKNLIIQVDGGINKNNYRKVIDFGADIISIGSYISNSKNPKKTFINIKEGIKKL
jgi:ribulose-phosphate 3-epimerase